MWRSAVLPLLMLAAAAVPSGAQRWRTVEGARQASALDTLRVRVDYTVGQLSVGATDSLLYRATLRYDAERFDPVRDFDASTGTLRVGVHGDEGVPLRIGADGREHGSLALVLSRRQPVDLELELGATQAELDLGGIPLTRLEVNSGASDLTLRFAAPNPVAMRELSIDAGVARVAATQLGNANAERVRVKGVVGSIDLDLSGTWVGTRVVQVSVTLGAATVRVPRGTGIRVKHSRVLAAFDARGLTKVGGEMVSENWEGASQRLLIDARTTFGALTIRWIEE